MATLTIIHLVAFASLIVACVMSFAAADAFTSWAPGRRWYGVPYLFVAIALWGGFFVLATLGA